ncbi:MAG: carbon monoxide dehydrogenase subunit G [Anaerolineae bacterium]|nr:carbon monoxide dehydrogenase subunit G [Anaerolineae bacterium]
MDLAGTYTFDAPRDEVWQALMDPAVLVSIMPGCESLEEVGENEYQTTLKIKVGPVQGKFKGNIELLEINEPDSYRMKVDGQGPSGFMKGDGQVKLESQGDSTLMHYTGTAQVGGRIASVGQRLLDSSAKAITKQSLDGLNQQITARQQAAAAPPAQNGHSHTTPTPTPTPVATKAIEPPSEMEFALGVAKNMLDDAIPAERRPLLLAVVSLVLVAFIAYTLGRRSR